MNVKDGTDSMKNLVCINYSSIYLNIFPFPHPSKFTKMLFQNDEDM